MRAQLPVLRGRVERAAGPGEPVFVDTYGLALALYVAGSPELRQQLVYAGTGVEPDSLLGRGEEAVVTTAHEEALERSLRSKGWVVRPPMGDRNGETFAGQNVRVFFVVRPEVGR